MALLCHSSDLTLNLTFRLTLNLTLSLARIHIIFAFTLILPLPLQLCLPLQTLPRSVKRNLQRLKGCHVKFFYGSQVTGGVPCGFNKAPW